MAEQDVKKEFFASYGLSAAVPLLVARGAVEAALDMPGGALIPFLISVTAQGKTAMVHQVAKARGYRVVTLSMVGLEPTDLTGLPFFEKGGETFRYVPDGRIPIGDDKEKVVLFLDEVNRCEPHTMNALFQLLNGWLGPNKLGENVRPVLAANPAESTYAVAGQVTSDPALIRRCVILPVQRTTSELLAFARNPGAYGSADEPWHQIVIDFLAANASMVHDVAREESGEVFATAAGWERVSNMLKRHEQRKKTLTRDEMNLDVENVLLDTMVQGTVGGAAGYKFMSYYTNIGAQIPPKEIVESLAPGTRSYELIRSMSEKGQGNALIDVLRGVADYISLELPDPKKAALPLSHIFTLVDGHVWEAFGDILRDNCSQPHLATGGYTPRYVQNLRREAQATPVARAHMEQSAGQAREVFGELASSASHPGSRT